MLKRLLFIKQSPFYKRPNFVFWKWPFWNPFEPAEKCISKLFMEWYPIFNLKMAFFDPLVDLKWPRDTLHRIQENISHRSICTSCVFGRVWDFSTRNDLFWPLSWPRMTSRCLLLNSEKKFQSNGMHTMCIWPYFRFSTPNDLFWPRKMTSNDLEMHTIEFGGKFPTEWYAYHVHFPNGWKKTFWPLFWPQMVDFRSQWYLFRSHTIHI